MESAAVPQQPLSNGSPAQQPSQVPVNVALPVTQWNEAFGWPGCEGFLLLLIRVKHHLIWNLVCLRQGKKTTYRFPLGFLLRNEANHMHTSLLTYLYQTLDEVHVAFLWTHRVKILCKQIHGFLKSLQYPALYHGLSHLDFSLLSVCDIKGHSIYVAW